MLSLGLLLYVRERTGSFGTAGLAVGALVLGEAATAAVHGTLVDRFGPSRVVAACAGAQGTLLLGLVAAGESGAGAPVLIALCALIGTLVPPVSASARALWPRLTPDLPTREALFALDASTQEIIWTSGPMLVALGAAVAGPVGAVVLTAAITLVGGSLFAVSPVARMRPEPGRQGRRGSALSSRGLRLLLPSVLVMGVGLGHLEVALPALAVDAHADGAAGALLAVWSLGSLVGGVVYGSRSWGWPAHRRHTVFVALVALSVAPLLLAGSVAAALPLGFVAGLFIAPAFSCQFVIVGAMAPQDTAAEAFAWYTTALVGGVAAGVATAGQLVEARGVQTTVAAAIGALLLAALAATRVPALSEADAQRTNNATVGAPC
ncbi:MFS transporter [Conexibacter woesei]|nr:MFS transporter [Conexibacter woesei]